MNTGLTKNPVLKAQYKHIMLQGRDSKSRGTTLVPFAGLLPRLRRNSDIGFAYRLRRQPGSHFRRNHLAHFGRFRPNPLPNTRDQNQRFCTYLKTYFSVYL